jgi:mRNA interferase MazF
MIVCMITSRMFRSNHPSRVPILLSSTQGQKTGLLTDSVIMADNLATIALTEIDRVIGALEMGDVDAALRHTLSL